MENVDDLRRAISLEPERRAGRQVPRRSHRPQLLQYTSLVRYVEQLQRYHAVFPREQVLTLVYEDFRRDNHTTLGAVLRHLEVEREVPIEVLDANPTVRMRSQRLDDVVHAISVGRGPAWELAKRALKLGTPQELRRRALRFTQRRVVHASPRAADEELMVELRLRFRPEVERLSDYLGRDMIDAWGYDRLD